MRTSQTPLLAPPSAPLVLSPRHHYSPAPPLLASDQAAYPVAPIAVHAGLIFNGAILSAGKQEACDIRFARRIVESFGAGGCLPARSRANSRLCAAEYPSQ